MDARRNVPVTRTQRKQRGLAFVCGLWAGMLLFLAVAMLIGVT